jgi:hypothetical protein
LDGEGPVEPAGCVFKDLKLPDYLVLDLLGQMLLEGAACREEI